MFDSIREYLLDRLQTNGGLDEARRRHSKFYLHLAEQLATHRFTRQDATPEREGESRYWHAWTTNQSTPIEKMLVEASDLLKAYNQTALEGQVKPGRLVWNQE